ncbi:hypothetical protein J2X03_000232 [Microbacterium trichothecenolyticum]|uniref:DUF6226 family protein n=1 Tax=Microbacterium trichothecenolyticum TaxID=69370 RepID=UPI00285DE04A|nr:DUF6226 family protein [Microbacterium trichothecenolyticum]MDR7110376.1 hypothetical protein [Microbacterium trichothecenolyticum]
MPGYLRPSPPAREFVDASGAPIAYGERWGGESPPHDTYSVTSNLERFAPLHDVADALITWLEQSFDVTVEDSPEAAADLARVPADAVRAVRVRPADDAASPLTFVFTSFPGIHLHAGFLVDAYFPVCGCDACDEIWESTADEMDQTVFSVVEGGLSERFTEGAELPVSFRLQRGDGWRGGTSRAQDHPAERLAAANSALVAGRTWVAWQPR